MGPTDGDGLYSIGAVAKVLGVPTQTLRSWEERYGQVVPVRSAGGQRLYSREQVDQLCFVVAELDRGMQPADAHRLLNERSKLPVEARAGLEVTDTILLAERDRFAADWAELFLRTEGYQTQVAPSVEAAGEFLQEERPGLVVIDLMISGGSGLDLCRRARALGTTAIIAVSPLDSRDDALEAGADAFLLKPVDPLDLVSTVRDLLATSAYRRRSAKVK